MKSWSSPAAVVALAWIAGCGHHDGADHAHWGYDEDHGPEHWVELSPEFSVCAGGKSQSPIDIAVAATVAEDLHDLVFDYAGTATDIVHNGHTIQVNVGAGHTLEVGPESFQLAQFHFHGPSEHTIDGEHARMEMHLVHESAAGKLAVVGVMMRPGAEHAALAAAWEHMPKVSGGAASLESIEIQVAGLLPEIRHSYQYDGSLTTPPCTEGVRWFVLAEGIEASEAQLAAFEAVTQPNNRPVQPVNGRMVRIDSTN
jgi:carbonic anhydrase